MVIPETTPSSEMSCSHKSVKWEAVSFLFVNKLLKKPLPLSATKVKIF